MRVGLLLFLFLSVGLPWSPGQDSLQAREPLGRSNRPPPARFPVTQNQEPSVTDGTLLITEVYYDAAGRDELGEWFEVANVGEQPLLLDDYKVGDEEQMGRGEGMARFPDNTLITPGQVLVIARSAVGFRALFGANPDFEIDDSDPNVPDMERSALWATGKIELANDGDELLLAGPDNIIRDALSYGSSDYFFSPPVPAAATGQSLARIPADCDSDSAADWQIQTIPSPGAVSREGDCATPPDPLAALALLSIGEIQGSGDVSPYEGAEVAFAGTVTGSYEDRNMAGITYYTLFVQDLPERADGDPATSDGIAVFLGRRRPTWVPGDPVLVRGTVTEFYGLTEIDDAGLSLEPLPGGRHALPAPARLTLPLSAPTLEALEAMRVALPPARVTGATHQGCGFAVVPATAPGERLLRERESDPLPGLLPVLHTSDVSCDGFPQVKVGDLVRGLDGPLLYHFDQFKLVQQETGAVSVDVAPLPPFPVVAPTAPGQLTLASFNLHDYLEADEGKGVKQIKLAQTIESALRCPTLLGVQEVENRALLEELANALADSCGFTYAIAHADSADVRGIDVALLVDPRQVAVTGVRLRQRCTTLETGIGDPAISCPPGEEPLFSRPPLQVALEVGSASTPYTVFVNHFKSKRGGERETAARRLAQARHVDGLVAALLASDAQARVVVMGDFNDYALSPVMEALTGESGRLDNVLLSLPAGERYSYNFGGASQLLDGLLLSPALLERVDHVEIVHVNADYPAGWAGDPTIPFHSSDHDIPYLVLEKAPPAPTATATVAQPGPPPAATVLAPTRTAVPPTATATEQLGAGQDTVTIPWPVAGTLLLLLALGGVLWQRRR